MLMAIKARRQSAEEGDDDAHSVLLSVRAEARQLVTPAMPCWTG